MMRVRFPRRGDWVPLIPPKMRWPILAVWTLEPILRGIDYLTGDHPETTTSLTTVERNAPLWVWGVLFLGSGLAIAAGFLMRRATVAIMGLHLGGSVYFVVMVGLVAKTIERGGDGFRTPAMFAVFALSFWWAALGYAMQRRKVGVAE